MKHLLKTTLNARKQAQLHTKMRTLCESAAYEAAQSPCMSKGVSACGTSNAPVRFGTMALALAIAAMALFAACSFVVPQKAWAADPADKKVEVSNVDQLLDQIAASRMMSYDKDIVLTKDINFNEFDPEGTRLQEIVKAYGSLTFGNKDNPFKGSFDGQGHYIIGLNYKRDFWKPVANTGLFSFTDGAYIHDIHFRDCYIGADYRGGVLVGQAKNTRIESVRMENCTLSVTPANNSVSLITNAGIMGGLIAGELLDSYMYDCTAQGGRVVNNSVVAVSGLGGEGLYLGALVGSAERSQIEYCRVIPTEQYYKDRAEAADPKSVSVYDENHKYLTEVYNRYEVAIGAVAGQSVYAGGVVGYIKDVDVVDCFSTAWVHTWVANYVGVGAGNIGYVGGIAAISRSDDTPETKSNIIRSHYASNMESYQYNALAVIPIIQSNVYLSGLLERDWEEDTGIYNSYFKRNDIVGKDSAIKPYPDGYVRAWGDWLGLNYSGGENGPSAQGFGYGPIVDDAKYADRLFWEGEGYDFEGDEDRASDANADSHVNKWIMDEYLGIPVHGDSVKATLDFPGAGDVTMSATKLGKEQKTDDPYNFAVQGVTANEESLTFTATLNEDRASDALNMVSSDANKGFRFQGWFRNEGVTVNHTQKGNHKLFDPMVPPEPNGKQVFNNEGDKLNLVYAAENSGTGADEDKAFKDNDLFVAYYQAQVLFHDVNGNVINKADSATEAQPQTEDDWYNHQDVLPIVGEPTADREGSEKASVADAAKFLGWTTRPNPADAEDGWSNVTVSDLNSMKAAGEFFEGGESIERPMDLYPVYASLAANINVIAEGHELVSSKHGPNVREGVVEATVTAKDGQYELSIKGLNADGTSTADGALPDGYRFLGWYEVKQDENGDPVYTEKPGVVYSAAGDISTAYQYEFGRKLSADSMVTIPDDVDLTQKHYYYARFEYRVDYHVAAYLASKVPGWDDADNPRLYTERWKPYLANFDKLRGPRFYDEQVDHWSLNSIKNHQANDDATTLFTKGIVSYQKVYGHNVENDDSASYDIVATFDFPNSALIDMTGKPWLASFEIEASVAEGFDFIGWSWIKKGDGGIDKSNPWKAGIHGTASNYAYEAHIVANVTFVDGAESGNKVVHRAYSDSAKDVDLGFVDGFQKVLLSTNSTYQFRYQDYPNASLEEKHNGLTVEIDASPTNDEMQAKRPNSLFLGWIDKSEIKHGTMTQTEYETVYDETTRTAKVSLDAIVPYLVTEKTLCERPMELYPVYADYSYDTTTNITRGTDLPDPADPSVQPNRNDDGTMTLTLEADVDEATVATYDFVSWTVESPEGTVIDTVRATDAEGSPASAGTAVSNGNATLKYTIKAGSHYMFVANYKAKDVELDVTYHVRQSGGENPPTEIVKKKAGDALGKAPAAMFQVENAAFIGWTEQKPEPGEYLMFNPDAAPAMVDEYTVVERPMELWPVYRVVGTEGDAANVRVNSNIDDAHDDPDNHRRAVVKTATTPQGPQTYVALEADPVDGYKFVGWYKDYADVTVDKDGKVTVTGTPVPGNRVTGEEMFAGNLYTAVYVQQQVYSVVYHFPDMDGAGPDTESVDTLEFAADDTSKFVQKVMTEQPKKDENGNLVYDQDGNVIMEKVEVEATVVGGEQTSSMEGYLSKKDAQGDVKELFKEWEWKKSDTETLAWNEFCGNPIVASMKDAGVTEMHLYPVTHRLNALDENGGGYTANLVWQIDSKELANPTAQPDDPKANPAVKIAFAPSVLYLGNKLTIHMDEVHYAKEGQEGHDAPMDGKLVALYDHFDFTAAKELDRNVTGHLGKGHEGDAVFEFKNDGSLVIEKTAPASASGTTFFFEVEAVTRTESVGDDGATNVTYEPTGKKATASVTVEIADGKAGAVGSVAIDLPWGYYRVTESNWSWQYDSTVKLLMDGFTNENLPSDVILVKSKSNEAQAVNVTNGKHWLGGEVFVKNEFGQGATAATDVRAGRANLLENPTAEGGN